MKISSVGGKALREHGNGLYAKKLPLRARLEAVRGSLVGWCKQVEVRGKSLTQSVLDQRTGFRGIQYAVRVGKGVIGTKRQIRDGLHDIQLDRIEDI